LEAVTIFGAPQLNEHANESTEGGKALGILWIILIVVVVLALLGFFARGF
jgi:flagellar basal body-associated protein FliL